MPPAQQRQLGGCGGGTGCYEYEYLHGGMVEEESLPLSGQHRFGRVDASAYNIRSYFSLMRRKARNNDAVELKNEDMHDHLLLARGGVCVALHVRGQTPEQLAKSTNRRKVDSNL